MTDVWIPICDKCNRRATWCAAFLDAIELRCNEHRMGAGISRSIYNCWGVMETRMVRWAKAVDIFGERPEKPPTPTAS